MAKRLLVMAGGTGGHVFPGLAVAKHLQAQGWSVEWLGTAEKMEATLVPKEDIPIHFISVSGVRGKGLLTLLKAPLIILGAIVQAYRVMKQVKPNVVLGMGGYASGPGGIAAWLRGAPLILHEQNAVPGMTNKILAPLARRVLTAFKTEHWHLSQQKLIQVGNPVRSEFANVEPINIENRPVHILIAGGSLGALALNQAVPGILSELSNYNFEVRHQAGKGKAEQVVAAYESSDLTSERWQVAEFLSNIVEDYEWADLIICRAGALTVSEVALAGRCAIFVPLPHAVDDHQTKNAEYLVGHESAFCVPQQDIEPGKLKQLVETLLSDPNRITETASKARKLGLRKSTESVGNICISEASE